MILPCFKAYDVRGRVGDELNEDLAFSLGRAYGQLFSPAAVAVGGDARLSSESLKNALAEGLCAAGTDVLDLGLAGTEEVYFAVFSQKLDGGLMVTGSHNPISDNGIKFVRAGARPVSGDNGLWDLEKLAVARQWSAAPKRGRRETVSFRQEYVEHLLGYIDLNKLKPMTIVVNPGNGAAGPVLDCLERPLSSVPIHFEKINYQPDGRFPNGIPNPLLPDNRGQSSAAVERCRADLGLAWDGDFDRCFFFDEKGRFIEGYYMVGLLAEALLASRRGAAIIHDPRLTWNTVELVERAGGRAVQSKTGHAFMKEAMRREKALYGGEMSAHHYFADFSYCDSGMIPWLLLLELMSVSGASLSELVARRQAAFPCSGEINYRVEDAPAVLANIERALAAGAVSVEHLDGLSMEFADWRFNLRRSNTEPLLRLNLETRGQAEALTVLIRQMESYIFHA